MAAPMSEGHNMELAWGDARIEKKDLAASTRDDAVKSSFATEPAVSSSGPTPQPHYVPQFSGTTSFILNRINKSQYESNSAKPVLFGASAASAASHPDQSADGETRKASLFTSQSAVTQPTKPNAQGSQQQGTLPLPMGAIPSPSLNPSLKRKRDPDAEKVDFTQNTIAFPTPVRSSNLLSAQVQSIKSCLKCQRSDSLPQNPIFQCQRCHRSWHKQCASPTISQGGTSMPGSICADCSQNNNENHLDAQSSPGLHKQSHIERMRQKRLSGLPRSVVPPKAELVGFNGGSASSLARTEYFYGKTKTELLNVLSFCDQLKPQLLVDLLVSVSKKHPELPIFDSPEWANQVPSASRPKTGAPGPRARAQPRARHGHVLTTKPRQRGKTARRPVKSTATTEIEVGEVAYEEEDTMPSTWPKAGEGLYAKLVPEIEDRLFLADQDDEEAFSHFMVDKLGRQIVEPV